MPTVSPVPYGMVHTPRSVPRDTLCCLNQHLMLGTNESPLAHKSLAEHFSFPYSFHRTTMPTEVSGGSCRLMRAVMPTTPHQNDDIYQWTCIWTMWCDEQWTINLSGSDSRKTFDSGQCILQQESLAYAKCLTKLHNFQSNLSLVYLCHKKKTPECMKSPVLSSWREKGYEHTARRNVSQTAGKGH